MANKKEGTIEKRERANGSCEKKTSELRETPRTLKGIPAKALD
jgi:hypothetical protein